MRVALGIIFVLLGSTLLAEHLGWLAGWQTPVWTIVLSGIGLIALAVAVGGRQYWWAIIPACLFLALAVFIYVAENNLLQEDIATGGFLFLGLGLPFWLILLVRGRSFWWAAIPGGVLTFIALSVGLTALAGERWAGVLVMWGIASAFWVVYLVNRDQWWALIPAGTMTTVGLTPLVADTWPATLVTGMIFGGLAATFLLIYLLSGRRKDFAWALWPAGVCLLLTVGIPLLGQWADLLWPVALIGGGVVVLLLALRGRRH